LHHCIALISLHLPTLPQLELLKMASIPTISLSQAGTRQLSEAILDACTGPGFFYLTDIPIKSELIEAAWMASESLFLDQSEQGRKAKMDSRNRPGNTGYTALLEEKLAATKSGSKVESQEQGTASGSTATAATVGDLKESFYIARLSSSTPSQQLPPILQEHRAQLDGLFESCKEVCSIVMKAFAVALGLQEEYFASSHHAVDDRLRLIHYPPTPLVEQGSGTEESFTIRAGSHSDYGSITLLFQRGVSGLQVLNQHYKGGEDEQEWIDIPPKKGAIVVNVGDALEFWTSAVFRSTQHRVVMPRTKEETVSRFSM
jgi:isopenicillin N synthase-like dioxygenase